MNTKASEGLAAVAELDSILTYQYRHDPALLQRGRASATCNGIRRGRLRVRSPG
jgi:hypothetical protein